MKLPCTFYIAIFLATTCFFETLGSAYADETITSNSNDALKDKRSRYIDPKEASGSRRCPKRPYRPGWAVIHPHAAYEADYAKISQNMYTVHSYMLIKQAGVCNCNLLYPEYEAIKPAFELAIDDLNITTAYEYFSHPELASEQILKVRSLHDLWRNKARDARRANTVSCRGVK